MRPHARLTFSDQLASACSRRSRCCSPRPENTVSSIARLLGVSRSTIYKYVPELATGHRAVEEPTSEIARRSRELALLKVCEQSGDEGGGGRGGPPNGISDTDDTMGDATSGQGKFNGNVPHGGSCPLQFRSDGQSVDTRRPSIGDVR
jgi:hypothetical protein